MAKKPVRRSRPGAVQHCPQCHSTRLVYEAGLITGQKYHCLECNYVGAFVIETEKPLTSSDDEP